MAIFRIILLVLVLLVVGCAAPQETTTSFYIETTYTENPRLPEYNGYAVTTGISWTW